MEKWELEAIAKYCVRLTIQSVPSLALDTGERRHLKDLIFKWCREQGIEIPLGARPHDVGATT